MSEIYSPTDRRIELISNGMHGYLVAKEANGMFTVSIRGVWYLMKASEFRYV